MSGPENWEAKTPPESLTAMRRAIEANTVTVNAALEWSAKTYSLMAPLAVENTALTKRANSAQRGSRLALLAASVALVTSFLGLACELVR